MPKPPVPPALEDFLKQPNPAVIATLQSDGSPHSTPTWYVWDNGRVLVNMDASRKRLGHLRRDRRASITVLGKDDWSHHVTLAGRVTTIEDDADFQGIDRVARHYTGEPFPRRDSPRVNGWLEVEWWHGWAGGGPWTG
jgi:PPOX class probable F420-dependent enzyme